MPFVKNYYTTEENKEWYKQKQLAKQGALSVEEVDKLLKSQERALMNKVSPPENDSPKEPSLGNIKQLPDKESRKNIFKDIDPIGRE